MLNNFFCSISTDFSSEEEKALENNKTNIGSEEERERGRHKAIENKETKRSRSFCLSLWILDLQMISLSLCCYFFSCFVKQQQHIKKFCSLCIWRVERIEIRLSLGALFYKEPKFKNNVNLFTRCSCFKKKFWLSVVIQISFTHHYTLHHALLSWVLYVSIRR